MYMVHLLNYIVYTYCEPLCSSGSSLKVLIVKVTMYLDVYNVIKTEHLL